MAPTSDPLDEFIESAARVLGLPIDPAETPTVRAHLEVMLDYAKLLTEFDLPDGIEPAPVFEA
jgi:hypothetical protein